MSDHSKLTVLCVASYEKGAEFMRECKRQGCRVILLTSKSLEYADWPKESLDQIFFIPDVNKEWNLRDVIYGVSFLARTENIDRIVALDDFDVEKAAALREHLRSPGMGDTTARYFRDKLAMRTRAQEAGILVPEFVHILNYDKVREFLSRVNPPYVLKPRLQAGAIGIKKIHSAENLWRTLNELGDEQSFYVLEQFVPGNIYHVDSIIYNNEVVFSIASQYGLPPMEVAHQGRVFSTRTMVKGSTDEQSLQLMNKNVLKAFGMVRGVSHTEFIKASDDGRFYFLETSARVGGANIVELVEAATGMNLWAEWAKIEILRGEGKYQVPKIKSDYAGLLISLAKQEWPDLSSYNDSEIFWKMKKQYHAGLIFNSPNYDRVEELLQQYTTRFYEEFFTSQPLPDKPSN
ncbi:MAG TPA: ATP-grasp domain-containing protein [Ignavibacteriaceae bacterium]|nr:ATP-grasp domain-containing protein [Ignavibacteriaceae bacterium]